MSKQYLGHLPTDDPLYHYLHYDVLPKLTWQSRRPDFRVYRLAGSNDVYLYKERHSNAGLVGKFFYLPHKKHDATAAAKRMTREYENLCLLRGYGFIERPLLVVRPLGYNQWLNCLLVVEYQPGELFASIIDNAIHHGGEHRLYRKLSVLAKFLAMLHIRGASDEPVDFNRDCFHLDRMAAKLLAIGGIGHDETVALYRYRDQWRYCERMWTDRRVRVHGDATPGNFLFGGGEDVIAFDLERSKRADRVFDLGRITGELKHFFMSGTGDRHAAEPFIGHFLWEYARHFPDRAGMFHSITERLPFYLGLTLLRIARNSWIHPGHRAFLIHEAKNNLRRLS